ncbi:GntR family transcriptional regulator [Larkinella sp. GY13]|uniref:GntR family transcriptional regulator n=1 Tax=Larkinella sp. GY13 TaxID=3453720 RepID=UPI003EEF1571
MNSHSELDNRSRLPRYQQVANAILSDIEKGILTQGDRLPSINEACAQWYLSKDSIKRAYETLCKSGFITSVHRRGFFIAGSAKRHALRVLMVAGQLTDSVKQLHDAITANLDREVIVDVCSYNYQRHLLRQVLTKNLGDYHYFVLMPHLIGQDPDTLRCLRNVPGKQLILVGHQWQEVLQHGHHLRYGGETALFEALHKQLPTLRKYNRLNLVLPENDCFDAESIRAFRRFCQANGFDFELLDELTELDLHPCQAYFLADCRHLTDLLDYCQRNGLQLGEHVGVVSFLETDFTRLLAGGVSVIAHPSAEVGRLVAQILSGQPGHCPVSHFLPLYQQFRASC